MSTSPPDHEDRKIEPPPTTSPDQGSRFLIFSFCFFIILGLITGVCVRLELLEPKEIIHNDLIYPIDDIAPPESGVEFGTYIVNLYNLDTNQKIFSADGWIWIRWPSSLQTFLEKKKIEPLSMIRLVNQVNTWDFSIEPHNEKPDREADGRYYQRFKFSGSFYANGLNFKAFPFHTIKLPLAFELEEKDFPPEFTNMKLRIDQAGSGIGRYIDLMGYATTDFSKRTYMHQYATTMNGQEHRPGMDRVHQLRFEVSYKKSVNATLLRIILPLVVVMVLVIYSPSLPVSCWELRVTIPPTIILSLIFLQQGYQTTLPELPYLTPMDTLYNGCYLVNLVLFTLYIYDILLLHEVPESGKAKTIEKIKRMDRWMQIFMVLFLCSIAGMSYMSDLLR